MIVCASVHVPVLAELYRACFETPWREKDIAEILAMPGAFGLIASVADAPAGFILARGAGGEGEIVTLGVLAPYRRRGLAGALVRAAEEALGQAGADRIFLEVAETNAAARALYRALGYREAGRRAGYYRTPAGPVDALILRADRGGDPD
ncbi:MAG: GNAT family N-acetyltransferase [Rhodospirillales bacterium]